MAKLNYIEQQEALATAHQLLTDVSNSLTNEHIISDLRIAMRRIENWMSKEDSGEFTYRGGL